jgi:hypothetical protein
MTLEEHESEFADLQFVAMTEQHPVDALLVNVGAVQGASVARNVAVSGSLNLSMTSRDGDVIKADFAVGVTAELRGGLVEGETSASLCSSPNDQDADLEGQLTHRDNKVVVRAWRILQRIDRRQGDSAVV